MAVAVLYMLIPSRITDPLPEMIRDEVFAPLFGLNRSVQAKKALFDDPIALRAERDSLAVYIVTNAGLASENERLRDLLHLKQRLPASFVTAEVQRARTGHPRGAFLLAWGSKQGVEAAAPVVTATGLMGQLTQVGRNSSVGIDWTHEKFRASAVTSDAQVFGIVESRQSEDGEPQLALVGTPLHVRLKPGVRVFTSGHGGSFPEGIPIGTISAELKSEEGWSRSYLLAPSVGLSDMRYVFVLGAPRSDAIYRDLVREWGLGRTPVQGSNAAADQDSLAAAHLDSIARAPMLEHSAAPRALPPILGEPLPAITGTATLRDSAPVVTTPLRLDSSSRRDSTAAVRSTAAPTPRRDSTPRQDTLARPDTLRE